MNKIYVLTKKLKQERVKYRKDIGIKVKTARQNLRLTPEELSNKACIGRATVTNIEKGAQYPTVFDLIALSGTLNVSTDWLLCLKD